MLDIEHQTRLAWDTYGKHHLERSTPLPEVDRIIWGPAAIGPGDAILGDIEGLRVLDIGCGPGRHAAHLARTYGAQVDGVDASLSQIERARARYLDVPDLRLVHADAVEYLGTTAPYDVIYSLSTFHFLDPHRLLPALSTAVKPGGRLYFTVLHTNSAGDGPASTVTPRPEILRLVAATISPCTCGCSHPSCGKTCSSTMGSACGASPSSTRRRRTTTPPTDCSRSTGKPRITARPRTAKPPVAHAAVGVGAVLLGPQGLLLGRHRLGTRELPGGTVEPGESLQEAVVRELAEETGLCADPADVRLLGMFLDQVGDVVRITFGALVTHWQGELARPAWRECRRLALVAGGCPAAGPVRMQCADPRSLAPGPPDRPRPRPLLAHHRPGHDRLRVIPTLTGQDPPGEPPAASPLAESTGPIP